jgi:hypothetical protein
MDEMMCKKQFDPMDKTHIINAPTIHHEDLLKIGISSKVEGWEVASPPREET